MLIKAIAHLGFNANVMALIKSDHQARQEVFALGASDYITTPVIPQELFVRVRAGCRLHRDVRIESQKRLSPNNPRRSGRLELSGNEKEHELVRTTCDYLLANLAQDHSLESLAQKMATNRNTLAISFKRVLGTGVFAWLRRQRMKKAQMLLKTTNFSIQYICYEVGYHDPANFSTAFKTFCKLAPQQYRNQ